MLKHFNSRIFEHISSQLDYFGTHISHLSTQEFRVKNGIIKFKGKGKALACEQQKYFRTEATTGNTSAVRRLAKLRLLREKFQKDTVGGEAIHSLCNTLSKQRKNAFQQEQQSTDPTSSFHYDHTKFFNDINSH